jgi:hypothetical protein
MHRQPSASSSSARRLSARFPGFALPTSNTTYTPNQFFDVCLPHSSRGCVRLVSLMIRKTLGWCDEHGRPQQEQIRLSYADFEAAGISRAMIKAAAAEAIKGRFIKCVREGSPKTTGQPAVSALYELNWDESGEHIKDPARFRGFFAGDGNRTYIPNQFFDHLIPREPLAVVKVVGSVIRFSIGFVNKWGHRRTQVALSYTHIQRYSKIRNRQNLAAAMRAALAANYLQRVEEGYFDPNGGLRSRKATYAVKWRGEATDQPIGMKNVPAANASKNRSEIRTGIGMKNVPGDRFENSTGIEIKQINNTLKQQWAAVSFKEEREDAGTAAVGLLEGEGFDRLTALKIASKHGIERIVRQIEWIDQRRVRRNRVGMLRLAIEQDWSKPTVGKLGRPNSTSPQAAELSNARDRLTKHFNSFST